MENNQKLLDRIRKRFEDLSYTTGREYKVDNPNEFPLDKWTIKDFVAEAEYERKMRANDDWGDSDTKNEMNRYKRFVDTYSKYITDDMKCYEGHGGTRFDESKSKLTVEQATVLALQGKLEESLNSEEEYNKLVKSNKFNKEQLEILYWELIDAENDKQIKDILKIADPKYSAKELENKLINYHENNEINEENDYSITIEENGEECPYLVGSSERDITDIDINNRNDLSEDELFVTGWVGSVQNEDKGPFNSFDEIDIFCYDIEKDNEYELPFISDELKSEFVAKVNNWIKSNK